MSFQQSDPFLPAPGDTNYEITPEGNSRPARTRIPKEQEENFGQDLDKALSAGKSRSKIVNHSARSKKWCDKQGWISTPCEMKDVFVSGRQSFMGKKHDLFGLFDRIAIDPIKNRLIGIQVGQTTSKKAKGASLREHLRKMCSTDIEKKTGMPFVECLRAWIRTGNPAIYLDWEQREKVGAQEWFPVVTVITEAMIADVESRRRKAA